MAAVLSVVVLCLSIRRHWHFVFVLGPVFRAYAVHLKVDGMISLLVIVYYTSLPEIWLVFALVVSGGCVRDGGPVLLSEVSELISALGFSPMFGRSRIICEQ